MSRKIAIIRAFAKIIVVPGGKLIKAKFRQEWRKTRRAADGLG